jgi:hypothetical protein
VNRNTILYNEIMIQVRTAVQPVLQGWPFRYSTIILRAQAQVEQDYDVQMFIGPMLIATLGSVGDGTASS